MHAPIPAPSPLLTEPPIIDIIPIHSNAIKQPKPCLSESLLDDEDELLEEELLLVELDVVGLGVETAAAVLVLGIVDVVDVFVGVVDVLVEVVDVDDDDELIVGRVVEIPKLLHIDFSAFLFWL